MVKGKVTRNIMCTNSDAIDDGGGGGGGGGGRGGGIGGGSGGGAADNMGGYSFTRGFQVMKLSIGRLK